MSYSSSQKIGAAVESFACRFLQQQGMTLVEKNFTCRVGEIDLIMQEGQALVFVEVRYRAAAHFGTSIESIQKMKQNKLVKTACYYLQIRKLFEKVPCRFDIIGVTAPLQAANVTWIKDAFWISPWTS